MVEVVLLLDHEYELYVVVTLSVTFPPLQNSVGPEADSTGTVAVPGFTVVVAVPEHPWVLVTVSVYVPCSVMFMDWVVAPVDHM